MSRPASFSLSTRVGKRIAILGRLAPIAVLIAAVLTPLPALSNVGTWSPTATSSSWASATNWNGPDPGAIIGTTNGDTALFNAASTTTTVLPDSGRNLANITFDGTAPSYTIGAAGGNALLLTSGGTIQIASTLTGSNVFETINAPLVLEGNYTLANNNNSGVSELTADAGGTSSGPVGTQTLTVTGVGATATGAIGGGNGTIAVVKNGTGLLFLEGNDTFTAA